MKNKKMTPKDLNGTRERFGKIMDNPGLLKSRDY